MRRVKKTAFLLTVLLLTSLLFAVTSQAAESTFTTSDYFDPPPAIHGNPWAPPQLGGIGEYVCDRLFEYAPYPEAKFIPMLAESFEEADSKTTIHLRKGVTWSDGLPFTSKDVICTYYLGFAAGWPMWKYADTIEAPDDYTVIINWRKPGPILSIMAFNNLITGPHRIFGKWADQLAPLTALRDEQGKVDEETNKLVTEIKEDLYNFKPAITDVVGTAAYTVSNVTASEAILVKREDSWCGDRVKVDRVRLQRYVSLEAYLSNVMAGAYDAEPHGLTTDVFAQIEKNHPDMKVVWVPEYAQPSMQFNIRKYPVNDPRVRKAIMYAIDKEALLPIAEPGTHMPDTYATGLVPSVRDAWFDEDFMATLEDYAYNPAKAEALLEEVGWTRDSAGFWRDADGKQVEIELASMNSWPIFFLCGDAITNMLNEFGIKAEFKAMELSAYWDYLNQGQATISFDFRSGAPTYGFPWEIYRNIYVDGAIRIGFKDPKETGDPTISIELASGEVVDPLALIDELFYAVDRARQEEIVQQLARATNECAPIMPIGEKAAPWKMFSTNMTYPQDPTEPEWYGGATMRPPAKLLKTGKMYFAD